MSQAHLEKAYPYGEHLDLNREWLETNGLGGYASSTASECHTRKYHGLLVAPLKGFGSKYVLLSKLETSLWLEGRDIPLATNSYPGAIFPKGYRAMTRFSWALFPQVTFNVGEHIVTRSIMMEQGSHTVMIRIDVTGPDIPLFINLRPLIAFREFHQLTHENNYLDGGVDQEEGLFRMRPYAELPPIYLDMCPVPRFENQPFWVHQLEYPRERDRGFDATEDLYSPGFFQIRRQPGQPIWFRASLTAPQRAIDQAWQEERARRQQVNARFAAEPQPVRSLKSRAEGFLITNARGERSIVAGYPWFLEWGRDAMIALPGLTVECGQPELAFQVLDTYLRHERHGLIPNYFDLDGLNHAYNSVDASLWFFRAAHLVFEAHPDAKRLRAYLPVMIRMLRRFANDQVPNVHCRPNGLLWVGSPKTNLTWMDAQVNCEPVTPRYGLAVEINALWYHALAWVVRLSQYTNQDLEADFRPLLRELEVSFAATFWCEDHQCLSDVVNDQGQDHAIRPNQILAAALPFSPLNHDQKRRVVRCVKKNLVTPYGLRTLAPTHPGYRPRYGGDSASRDSAYHQGTVWPWLMGSYVDARMASALNPEEARRELLETFAPLFSEHIDEAGLGGISEVFDGDPPHRPEGCISQAWSVAEVIRAWNRLGWDHAASEPTDSSQDLT